MGLQWQDFNWEDLTVFIRRGVVNGRSGDTKTEASQKSLPIDLRLARSLQGLLKRKLHIDPKDWVFANNEGWPRGQQNILQRHLCRFHYGPESERLVGIRFDTHTLRCCDVPALTSRCSKNCCGLDDSEHPEYLYASNFRAETRSQHACGGKFVQ